MKDIIWNDSLMAINMEIIDTQHKKLIDILNKLSHSILSNSQDHDILEIIDTLIDYIDIHFDTEETFFDVLSCEEKKNHIQLHLEFKKKILTIKNKIEEEKKDLGTFSIEILNDLHIFVSSWLINHIVGNDKDIFKLVKSKK